LLTQVKSRAQKYFTILEVTVIGMS